MPTHNRPSLFSRCLNSVLVQKNIIDYEIIVNNDSCDIKEIAANNIKYYYEKFDNLSSIYKFLLEKSSGEYVYFLEDDDYLKDDFIENVHGLLVDYDLISGNYFPTYIEKFLKSHINGEYFNSKDFVKSLDLNNLQLSKFIFKRSRIIDYEFKNDSNVHNDIDLVLHAAINSNKFICLPNVFYFQTVDGRDNISFEEFNDNIEKNYKFLEKYKVIL